LRRRDIGRENIELLEVAAKAVPLTIIVVVAMFD